MSKKISGAHIKINGALKAVLRIDKGAFTAAANISSPIDHVTFVEGATYRSTLQFTDVISLIIDSSTLTFGKNPNDIVNATDDRVIFVFDKHVNEILIASDTFIAELDFNLSITEYETILDRFSAEFSRPLASFLDSPTDSVTLQPEKGLRELVPALDELSRVVDYNKPLADFPVATETLFRSVSYNRAYEDVTEVVSDLATITAGKAFDDSTSNDDTSARLVVKGLFDEPVPLDALFIISSFYRTLSDVTEPQERKYLSLDKILKLDSFAASDVFVLEAIKGLADVFYSVDQKTFNIIKSFKDVAQALDLIAVFDGSQYIFGKSLSDSASTADFIKIVKSEIKTYLDSVSIFDDINTFDFIKQLADNSEILDTYLYDYHKLLTDAVDDVTDNKSYSLLKQLSEELLSSDSPAWSFTRPLPNQTVSTLDYRVKSIIKAFSEELITLDELIATDGSKFIFVKSFAEIQHITQIFYKVVSFNRQFIENERPLEGPSYGNESGYALGYFDPDDGVMYTEEFRPVWALNKVLHDSQSVTENLALDFNKPLATQVVSTTENVSLSYVKPFTDSVTIGSDVITRSNTFLRTFTELQYVLPGPIPFDQDDYSESYFDPDYIRDYRVLFNFDKALNHSVITEHDDPVFISSKILSDFAVSTEFIANNIIKILSSFAIPEDLAGIFDGSQYTFNKITAISASVSDDDTVQFVKTASDSSQGATSGGKLISSDYFEDLSYFTLLDDYIGQSRTFIPIEDLVLGSGTEDLMSSFGYEDLMV